MMLISYSGLFTLNFLPVATSLFQYGPHDTTTSNLLNTISIICLVRIQRLSFLCGHATRGQNINILLIVIASQVAAPLFLCTGNEVVK